MLRFTSPSISSRDHTLLHSPYLPLSTVCVVEPLCRKSQCVPESSEWNGTDNVSQYHPGYVSRTETRRSQSLDEDHSMNFSGSERAHSDDVPRASPQLSSSRDFSGGDFSLNYAYQWRVHAAAVIADGQVFIKPRSARRIYTPGGITNTTVWPSNDSHCASKRTHMGHDDMATDRETHAGRTERGR